MHADGVITEFNEKPQAAGGRISGGYFVATSKLFDYLNDDESLVFEQQPMRDLVSDRQLRVFEHDGFWQPMDTLRDKRFLEELWLGGNPPWKVW